MTAMSPGLAARPPTLALLLAGLTAEAGVTEVKTLYQEINALIERKATTEVALYADERRDGVEWRTVVGRADRDGFDQSYFRARVHLREARILKARLETTSPSGDWALTEDYYFRGNGRTAFYFQSLVTFQGYDYEHDRELPPGPYVVEERRYFDETGREIRHLQKAFVQQTGRELPVKYIRADLPVELFQDTRSLPFHRALSRQSRE